MLVNYKCILKLLDFFILCVYFKIFLYNENSKCIVIEYVCFL